MRLKRDHKILATIAAITVTAVTLFAVLYHPTTVRAGGILSLDIGISNVQPEITAPTLDIKFEPSGTHVKDGYLKIRLDFYPGPEDKSYESQHVFVVDESSPEYLAGYKGLLDKDGNPDPIEYQKWLDELPHIWCTNPALCHFVIVPESVTKEQLQSYILNAFTGTVTATIDDVITRTDSSHLISPLMRPYASMGTKAIVTSTDRDIGSLTGDEYTKYQQKVIGDPDLTVKQFLTAELVTKTNTALASLSITEGEAVVTPLDVSPQSIDAGAGATDRATTAVISSITLLSVDNPVNADGTLDTSEIWLNSRAVGSNIFVGVHYNTSGTTYQCRDSETIGNPATGSKQTTTGLNISTVAGDYASICDKTDPWCQIEYDTSGYSNVWKYSGEAIDAGDSASFSSQAGDAFSLYLTGTESGGTPDFTQSPSSKDFGVVANSATLYAKTGATPPGWPLTAGNCTFTCNVTGSVSANISVHSHNGTGGVEVELTSGSPGANQFRLSIYREGDAAADNTTLTYSDQTFENGLIPGQPLYWDLKLEQGTATDGETKSVIITFSAVAT